MKHKNINKFILTLALLFGGVFANLNFIHAEESTYLDNQTLVKKSEYESIKEQMEIAKSNALLTRSNSGEYIQLYKEAEQNMNILKEHIVSMNSKSTEELINLGYNNNQIDAIRNYDYSDQMTARASGYVSGNVYISSYYQQNNRTYVTITFSGNYNGAFSQQYQDNIGVGVVGSGANFYATSYNCTTVYSDGHTNTGSAKEYSGCGVVYAVGIRDMRSFTVNYSAVADGAVNVFQYGAAYFHTYYSVGLSGLSITANSLSLQFNINTKGSIEYENRITHY